MAGVWYVSANLEKNGARRGRGRVPGRGGGSRLETRPGVTFAWRPPGRRRGGAVAERKGSTQKEERQEQSFPPAGVEGAGGQGQPLLWWPVQRWEVLWARGLGVGARTRAQQMVRYFSSCPAVQSAADPCSICLESQGTAPGQADSISDTISAAFISLLSDPCLPLSPSTPPPFPSNHLPSLDPPCRVAGTPAGPRILDRSPFPPCHPPPQVLSLLLTSLPPPDCVALTSALTCSSRHPFSAPHRPTPTPLSRPMLPASLW